MKTGAVKAAIVVKSNRLDATFHLEPTRNIDLEIERRRKRMQRDRAHLRVLIRQRRQLLADHRTANA